MRWQSRSRGPRRRAFRPNLRLAEEDEVEGRMVVERRVLGFEGRHCRMERSF